MSTVKLSFENKINGIVDLTSSKSIAHRYIIIASFLNKKTIIKNIKENDDILATINICNQINNNVEFENNCVKINPSQKILSNENELFANSSGTTLRLLFTLLCFENKSYSFNGTNQLKGRNMDDVKSLNSKISSSFPLTTLPIEKDEIVMDGSISSQYISGAIIGKSLFNSNVKIKLTNINSMSYINLTIDVLNQFGIFAKIKDNEIIVDTSNINVKSNYVVEADWTHAINFITLNKLGYDVNVENLNMKSKQSDILVLDIINQKQSIIDCANIPDSVAILCLLFSQINDTTSFINIDRLKEKESNRIESTIKTLKKFNVYIKYNENKIIVKKSKLKLLDDQFDSFDDHRVVFLISIAAILVNQNVQINNAEAINKSYPTFFNDLENIGVNVNYE